MRDFARLQGVTMIVTKREGAAWRCILSRKGATMTVDYTGDRPTIAAVLHRVAENAATVDHATLDQWCAEQAITPNAGARRLFAMCQDQARQLQGLLGRDGYVTAL